MTKDIKRKVYVSLPEKSGLTEIGLLKLLSESEIDLSSVQFIRGNNEEYSIQKDDALIIPLSSNSLTNEQTAEVVLAAAQAGSCNIVGIWVPDESQSMIHPMSVRRHDCRIRP